MARTARRPADPRKAVGYLRRSPRGDGDTQHLGPEAQRAALERWAAAAGVELVAVHEDLDVSGAAPLDRRPGLLAALDALGAHGAGVLAVAKRDRLARDVVAAAMVERLAERAGARVVSAAGEGTDGDAGDPAAMLMRGIVDLFAQYERAVIRARTRAALAVKRGRGERTGSVPYGFRLAADGRSLEADPAEAEAVALARTYRAAGLTLRAIGERLAARGILPRSGRAWHPGTVARIVEARAA